MYIYFKENRNGFFIILVFNLFFYLNIYLMLLFLLVKMRINELDIKKCLKFLIIIKYVEFVEGNLRIL